MIIEIQDSWIYKKLVIVLSLEQGILNICPSSALLFFTYLSLHIERETLK